MDSESRERPVVQPAPDERCPECGEVIEQEWAYFRQDPDAPQKVLKHFSGVVKTAIEPKPVRPERSVRDISYPEDLGHFFHPWRAPRARLPAEVEEGFARIVAEAIYDDWVKKREMGTSSATCPGWRPTEAPRPRRERGGPQSLHVRPPRMGPTAGS